MKRRNLLKAALAISAGAMPGDRSDRAEAAKRESIGERAENGRWSVASVNAWHAKYPWIMGYNYIPSTAVNQLEMWQEETFDPETVDRELGLGAAIGLNAVRFWMHDIAWKIDPDGFKKRLNVFLELCKKHGTWAVPTFFTNGGTGPELEIRPGPQTVGWLQSPGLLVVNDPSKWSYLEDYVQDVLETFGRDSRILFWSLYNEPENRRFGENSLPLLRAMWSWSRRIDPVQPLTSPIFTLPKNASSYFPITCFLGEHCDVMSFHCYRKFDEFRETAETFLEFERPLFCTEYLARVRDNGFFNVAPYLKEKGVGAFHFGLVRGRFRDGYALRGPLKPRPEPKVWVQDIFRIDGTPYDPKEIEQIKTLTGKRES